jgi:hypothetical protein
MGLIHGPRMISAGKKCHSWRCNEASVNQEWVKDLSEWQMLPSFLFCDGGYAFPILNKHLTEKVEVFDENVGEKQITSFNVFNPITPS